MFCSRESERRHRIYESEIPAVKEGLKLFLLKLYEKMEELDGRGGLQGLVQA